MLVTALTRTFLVNLSTSVETSNTEMRRSITGTVLTVCAVNLPTSVDALPGMSWYDGATSGLSCTATCAANGAICDDRLDSWNELNSEQALAEASSFFCSGGSNNFANTYYAGREKAPLIPFLDTAASMCYHSVGTTPPGRCDASYAGMLRVCPCKCALNTYYAGTEPLKNACSA